MISVKATGWEFPEPIARFLWWTQSSSAEEWTSKEASLGQEILIPEHSLSFDYLTQIVLSVLSQELKS